jgi:rhodanese-related sulfurtransferase
MVSVSLHRWLLSLTVVPLVLVGVGCGGGDEPTAGTAAGATAVAGEAAPEDVIIIDVRTPEEYAEGHLAGAVNHNVEDGSLEAALADLDPDADYIVYCRSGRRSAIAVELMATMGFGSVTDLGAVEQAAAATGLDVVTTP